MYDIITDIWKHPGATYSPMPFWFWNDTLEKDTLVKQLDDFHRHGVDGVVIHPRLGMAGVEYLSEDYFSLVEAVCAEAKRRFMLVVLYDEAMYPSGSAHGRVVAEDERLAARRLYALPVDTAVPANEELLFRVYIRREDGRLIDTRLSPAAGYDGYNLVLGYTGGTIRGLTPDEDDGQPNAPKAADLLNPYATECFIRHTHEGYLSHLKDYFGQTVIGFFTDEPSLTGRGANMDGGISWSYQTTEYFMGVGGEIEQIAALLFEPKDKKLRREADFLYRKALRQNLFDAYYAPLSDWCKTHNIALMGHPADSADVDVQKYFHIPGQDLVWRMVEPDSALTAPDSVLVKVASDASRHRGLSRSSVEVFGACGEVDNPWHFTPDEMMWYLNFLFARGCSMVIPHAFYYSLRTPLQTNERPPDMGPGNIWWQDYKAIAGYIKRMSWLGASGTNNPHCAVLCSSDYVPHTPVKQLYELGYTFNYLSLDDLMERAQVHDGTIVIDRYIYDTVLIDGRLRMNADIVTKLGHFVTQGGKMHRGSDFGDYMKKNCHRTSYFDGETHGNLRFTHYTKSGCPFFLFVNEGLEPIEGALITDQAGAAEIFDPFTGKREPLACTLVGDGFSYPVRVPAHSALVIGMNPDALPRIGEAQAKKILAEITSLAEGRMVFEYIPAEGRTVVLSFTDIHEIAEVSVNGEPAARMLFRPYETDITALVHPGENEVSVVVSPSAANTYGKPVRSGFDGCTVRVYAEA